jgi:uncharacterized protein YjbI with pentapeptide repeats
MHIDLKNKDGEILYSCKTVNEYRAVSQALSLAIMNHIPLPGLVVENENLDDLNFSRMNIHDANFKHCSLKRTNFEDVDANILWFNHCDLSRSSFNGSFSKVRDLCFNHSTLKKVVFRDFEFAELHFLNCDCSSAHFRDSSLKLSFFGTNLENACFYNCNLRNAAFSGDFSIKNPIEDAAFWNCDVANAEFYEHDMTQAWFFSTNIQEAKTNHRFYNLYIDDNSITIERESGIIWFDGFRGTLPEFEDHIKELLVHPSAEEPLYIAIESKFIPFLNSITKS